MSTACAKACWRRCASDDVEITGGDEMILESITYAPVPTAAQR
jgi:Zn finger protein HypA/HybF involved in hydrogenase expression